MELNERFVENLFITMAEMIEMNDAIRQVNKYLSSSNPSIRILKQKLSKVGEKGEEIKRYHFEYCRKAKMDFQSEEVRSFITATSDSITDCVDAGLLYIEEREFKDLDKKKSSRDAEAEEEKRL